MITCPACGTENPEGARFCLQCGSPLAEAPAVREERKVVSIVFCDLVGSTARAEQLDPEDVRALLSAYHGRVRAILEHYGGTVEKFIGDAVVAVFGAPAVHEDDAERAVRAALAIREWAHDEDGLEVRIAVNTGEALVSVDARPDGGEGMVAGDVVNTAARLQGAAPVNGILVGEATYRATDRVIEYRGAPAVAAKGKAQPVAVWEVIAARSGFGVDVDLRPATKLVGRARELDQLLGALARARAEREPQLVTIVGVPGMGKSRLVQELSLAVDADPDIIRWRQGRSLPYGQGVSYWALGEMLKAEAGILESDSGAVAEEKLRAAVGHICSAAEADWIAGELRPLIGLADQKFGADSRGEAFAAWRRFLEGLADERPTVLVFEDLHWADDGLLDFVDTFAERAADVPLLIVGTARPELLARRSGWGGGKSNAATLSLAPLSEHETAGLVHAILERAVLPADLQAAVLARAGGNPLYAEEFARMVAERGLDASSGELPLPESLQGVISARLDALTREEKEVVQDASVVGKVFWPGALGRTDRGALDESLYALERKEFIRRERRSAVEDELQYAFRHVLVRDVAYAQIPRAARAEKHEQVAEWIESRIRGEDAAELLAHHYVSALEYAQAAGRESEQVRALARQALRAAGRRAVALNAFRSATEFFASALELTPEEDAEWPGLALDYADAGTYVDVSSNDRLLVRARERLLAGDPDTAARAELVLGEYRWLLGERGPADTYFRSAEALVPRMRDPGTKLRVLADLARFAVLADEYERGIALARDAIPLAENLGSDEFRAHALNSLGIARVGLGDRDGLADLEAAREIARAAGGPEYLRACGNLASTIFGFGELARVRELHEEALEIARQIGYDEPIRWLTTELASDLTLAGEWDEARRLLAELMPSYDTSPFWIEPQTRISRARILLAEGALDAARDDTVRALRIAAEADNFQSLVWPIVFSARLHAETDELDAAAEHVDEFFALWEKSGSGHTDEWVVEVWYAAWRTGREERLRAAIDSRPPYPWFEMAIQLVDRDFGAAVAWLDGVGARSCAALVRLWAADWLVDEGRRAEADVFLQPSLAFWRSVGATRYVRAGEALLAAAS